MYIEKIQNNKKQQVEELKDIHKQAFEDFSSRLTQSDMHCRPH